MKTRELREEYRSIGTEELETKIGELENELMNLRFPKETGQLQGSAQLGMLRRNIARAKTLLADKAKQSSEQGN